MQSAATVLTRAQARLQSPDISNHSKVLFVLRQADFQCQAGQREQRCDGPEVRYDRTWLILLDSQCNYLLALEMAEKEKEDAESLKAKQRILTRTQLVHQTAVAAETLSHMQHCRVQWKWTLRVTISLIRFWLDRGLQCGLFQPLYKLFGWPTERCPICRASRLREQT